MANLLDDVIEAYGGSARWGPDFHSRYMPERVSIERSDNSEAEALEPSLESLT